MLLALTMVLGMGLTSMAAVGESAVNITNTDNVEGVDATIKYAQIVVEDRGSTLGWKFIDKIVEEAFIRAFKGENTEFTADNAIEELIKVRILEDVNGVKNDLEGGDNVLAGAGKINLSSALGAALAYIPSDYVGYTTLEDNDTSFVPGTIGLYVIDVNETGATYIPMAVYVGTTFNGVTVTAKGSVDKVDKTISSGNESVSEGDLVDYTVTVEYPYYSADETTDTFKIEDTLTNATFVGLTNTDDVINFQVKIGDDVVGSTTTTGEGDAAVTVTNYTTELSQNDDKLTIIFDYNPAYAGQTVTITYKVEVGVVTSTSSLSNNVQSTIKTGTTSKTVISDSVDATVLKVEEYAEGTTNKVKLPGAVFTLYVAANQNDAGAEQIKISETEKVWAKVVTTATTAEEAVAEGKLNDGYVVLEGTEGADGAVYGKIVTATTGDKGIATFTGLDAQKVYYVLETVAPAGYSLNDIAQKLDIESTTPTEATGENGETIYTFEDFKQEEVKDTKLNALPSTGGIGTTIFTVAGCGIMIAAAFFFFASRKRENE